LPDAARERGQREAEISSRQKSTIRGNERCHSGVKGAPSSTGRGNTTRKGKGGQIPSGEENPEHREPARKGEFQVSESEREKHDGADQDRKVDLDILFQGLTSAPSIQDEEKKGGTRGQDYSQRHRERKAKLGRQKR